MNNDLFEKTPIPKAYMTLALPVVLSMAISLVYNMVDTYFIALTKNTDLVAGISLTVPVFTLMIAFGDIWGLGGSSLLSRLFGERKDKEARQIAAFSFWAAIVFGLCVTAIMLIFRSPILSALGANEVTWQYASDYYTWIVIGAAAIILGLVPGNFLRAEGLAGQAMIGSVLGSIANIILDPIFIFGLHQGAAGAAIATVLGNILADIYYAYVILKKSQRLSISFSDVKANAKDLKNILMIGIPASITNLMQSFMMAVTNRYLLPFGEDKIAAMGIALKVNMIAALILVGFAFGGQPLIGFNYGAKNKKRLKETIRFAYLIEAVCAITFTIVMILLAPTIIRGFMNNPSIIENGSLMLRCLQLGLIFMSIVLVSTCICQSFGNALGAFVLSISRQGVIYVIAIVILSNLFQYKGILISQACADAVTALVAVFIIRKSMKKIG